MRKWKKGMKRIGALVLAVVLLGTTIEFPVYATENQVISCEHHTKHTAECGYVEAQEEVACNHVCSEEDGCNTEEGNCIHTEHDDACGYKEAVEGVACAFDCDTCVSDVAEEVVNEKEENQQEEADLTLCVEEAEEIEEEIEEETLICTCQTDDPAFHATNCPVYEAPENPQCFCAEKCAEDASNVWCDVCGVQGVSACQGVAINMEVTYAGSNQTGAFVVTGGTSGTDYSYADGVLTIKTGTAITIANVNPSTATTDRIVVEKDKNANITLNGVNIDVSGTSDTSAFKIEDDSTGSVAVTLAEGSVNTLKSGENCAGLQKNGTTGSLEIKGTGELTAIGGNGGAGIGGGYYKSGSNITISSGEITAIGGGEAPNKEELMEDFWLAGGGGAGIGSGGKIKVPPYENDTVGTNITISGGKVTATGGDGGAGIGGGYGTLGGNITISGGEVTATGDGDGTGIGGGDNGAGSNIAISGGKVKAKGGGDGAGIGGSTSGVGTNIIISGGVVVAEGGSHAAGIGGGKQGTGSNITISDGVVTATGGEYGAGIGSGFGYSALNIRITGGSIKAVGGSNAIGGGYGQEAVTPTLEDGTTPVYLCEIENPDSKAVSVNGVAYVPNHKAADSTDTTLYAYLPEVALSNAYPVSIGEELYYYYYYHYTYITDYNYLSKWVRVSSIESGNFTVTGGISGTDYSYDDCVLTIKTDTPMTIKNTNPDMATTDRILIEEGINADITLDGVNIDVSQVKEDNVFAFKIDDYSTGNVTVNLAAGSVNTLKSGRNHAGLQKSDGSGTLEIKGLGTLVAVGGDNGAGIGGGFQKPGKNIIINGGVITAIGGENGAGIGGGVSEEGFNIRITGGSVKATSTGGNAIGGGYGKEALTPTFADGTTPVYLLEIQNPDSEEVSVNNVAYVPNHKAADRTDTTLYAYLPAVTINNAYKVRVGENTALYYYNAGWNSVDVAEIPEPDDTVFVYDGSEQTYTIAESPDYTISDDTTQINAGIYTVTVTLNENRIWSDGTTEAKTYIFAIRKADSEVITAPAAITGLSYDDSVQELITEGTVTGGTILYSFEENGTYSTVIPTAKNADTYTVWYKVVGNENYNDIEPASIEVTIARKELAVCVTAADRDYEPNNNTVQIYVTLSGKVGSDEVMVASASDLQGTLSSASTGTYDSVTLPTLTLTGSDAGNYVLSQSTGEVELASPVRINKLNPTITAQETVTKTYGDEVFVLDVTENNSEADLQYAVTTGQDVVAVSSSGIVTILKAGNAIITVSVPESACYNAVSQAINVTVNKAAYAPNRPDNIMNVPYSNATVGTVILPEGWAWQNTDTELIAGAVTAATAVYTGTDCGSYENISVLILVTRAKHDYISNVTKQPSSGTTANDTSTAPQQILQIPVLQTTAPQVLEPVIPQSTGDIPSSVSNEETDTQQPYIKGEDSKEGWNVITDELNDMAEGDAVTVNMNGSTVVPGNVLEGIKGQDITMVIDLGNGVTWSVNGRDIVSDIISDIDFEVKVGTDAGNSIPADVHNTVTGENPFVNISLTYEGEFGFEAVLSVNMESENAGLFANLFYYNPQTNEMEFICSDEIEEDGTAELTFTHASEYIVVVDEVAFNAPASSEEGILPEIGVEAEGDNASDATDVSEPLEFGTDDSGSAWWMILLISILVIAGVAGYVVYAKKKTR